MNKIIIISIITSATLLSATVNNLTEDQVNKTSYSSITKATVNQGKTEIRGSSNVDGLTIIEKGANAGETGNYIDSLTVTGANSLDDLKIEQGRTIVDNAKVNSVTINSDSAINGGYVRGVGEVIQGETEVDGSVLGNVDISSTNTISEAKIIGTTERPVSVTQGTLSVSGGADATDDASATDIDITSKNTITQGIYISDSTVKQSHVAIDGTGTTVKGLNINQTNRLSGESVVSDNSTALQGIVNIDTDADVNGLKTDVSNKMMNFVSENSTTVQNHINIHTSSQVNNMNINTEGNHNTLQDLGTINSTVVQNTYNITNGSNVNDLTGTHNNLIYHSIFRNSHVGQDVVDINNSTVTAPTISSTNVIEDINGNSSSNINQAVIVVKDSSTVTSPNITSDNEIKNVKLHGTDIAQSYSSIVNSAVTDLTLNNTNKITDTDGTNNNIDNSNITQSELLVANSTVNTLSQKTANNITDSKIAGGSTIAQAKIVISGGSTVSNVNNGDSSTNDIDDTTITNGFVSQNGLRVCSSTVNGLNINQHNNISSNTISGSTITQGDINIGDNEEGCLFERAKYANKSF